MAKAEKEKQYIYIVQASLEPAKCKIGLCKTYGTNDLDRRLKEYNNMTGKSKDNVYQYLFSAEVKDMTKLENAVKAKFAILREEKSKEIYFYNAALFKNYIEFIKSHKLFIREIVNKTTEQELVVKIIRKIAPSLDERGLSQKALLQKAQRINNDEFYTRYGDVEKELSMYKKSVWKNKVVFCNCDDAVGDDERNTSAFPLYFIQKFYELGLKKLICTHYSGKVDLLNQGTKGYIFTKDGYSEFKEYPDGYNGSFDHPLSLKILNEVADIVCTNPPFSRAKEFWHLIVNSGKKFLIISNITNPITSAFIPYFKENKVWSGYNRVDWYLNPKRELTRAAGSWYTNIPIKNRPTYKHLKIMPLKEIPEPSKRYDDTKHLIVDNCYIPSDYKKPFAVSTRPILNGLLEKGYEIVQETQYFPYLDGKKCFGRVLVQKSKSVEI